MNEPFFFTWQAQAGAKGISLRGGDGAYFDTTDEGRFLDFGSLIYQANLGHGCRKVIDAVKEQAERQCLSIPSGIYEAKRNVARTLLSKAPEGFDRVFFTLGGAEANEAAMKIARLFTGRFKTVSRYHSYHGATMGSVSLTGDWRRPPVEPGLVGAVHVLDLDDGRDPNATDIPRVLELEGNVGAVFLEPIVGGNGVLIPGPDYFKTVRQACDDHGALLMVDEVLTGFGRTGAYFALDHYDVVPDMITLGKAITAGYGTLGAVLVHERVSQYFDDQPLVTGLTHYAHPLALAASEAALCVLEEEALVERTKALEPLFLTEMRRLEAMFPERLSKARGRGLLGAWSIPVGEAPAWKKHCREAKIHLHVNGHVGAVVLSPPLVIDEDGLRDGFHRIETLLSKHCI